LRCFDAVVLVGAVCVDTVFLDTVCVDAVDVVGVVAAAFEFVDVAVDFAVEVVVVGAATADAATSRATTRPSARR
jgi:hypothetical protein